MLHENVDVLKVYHKYGRRSCWSTDCRQPVCWPSYAQAVPLCYVLCTRDALLRGG